MSNLFTVENILQKINTSELCSIKGILLKIINTLEDINTTSRDIKNILEVDPPLMMKVLKKANSAYYYNHNIIRTIEEAVIWIGINNIKELILSQKMCSLFDGGIELQGFSRRKLWIHSISVAILSKLLFRREFGKSGNLMYTIAILHDIGIIFEDQILHSIFEKVLNDIDEDIQTSEKNIIGFTHSELGYHVCTNWLIPDDISNAIKYHHNPFESRTSGFKYSATVCICDYICQDNGLTYYDGPLPSKHIFEKSLMSLNLKPIIFKSLIKELKHDLERMESEGFL